MGRCPALPARPPGPVALHAAAPRSVGLPRARRPARADAPALRSPVRSLASLSPLPLVRRPGGAGARDRRRRAARAHVLARLRPGARERPRPDAGLGRRALPAPRLRDPRHAGALPLPFGRRGSRPARVAPGGGRGRRVAPRRRPDGAALRVAGAPHRPRRRTDGPPALSAPHPGAPRHPLGRVALPPRGPVVAVAALRARFTYRPGARALQHEQLRARFARRDAGAPANPSDAVRLARRASLSRPRSA